MYRRRRYRRKRKRSFRPGYDRRGNGLYRFSKRRKKGLAIEKKFVDSTTGTIATPIALTTNWVQIKGQVSDGSWVGIAQDNTATTRIGRKIVVTDILWKGSLELQANVASSTDRSGAAWENFRLVVYLDKQSNGAASASTLIFETDVIDAFRNIENASRFKILWDKSYRIRSQYQHAQNGATLSMSTQQATVKFKYHWRGFIPIEYNDTATTGAIGTVRSNNIGCFICGENTNSGSVAELYGSLRLRFYG